MTNKTDRIKGILLGQATADALGVHYETGIRSNMKAEMLGGGYGFKAGEWSDDSQQMLCIARAKSDPTGVAKNLLAWYASGPADVGPTASQVLGTAARNGGTPEALTRAAKFCAKSRGKGGGGMISNGGLMRNNASCLPYLGNPEKIAQAARELCFLTHFDDYAGDACTLWSLAINQAVEEGEAFDPESGILTGMKFIPSERQTRWYELIEQGITGPPPISNLATVRAFQAALWANVHAESFEHGAQLAINIGGDTDTVAAIAGGLLGARFGASTIPAEWLAVLHGTSFTAEHLTAQDLEQIALDAAGITE